MANMNIQKLIQLASSENLKEQMTTPAKVVVIIDSPGTYTKTKTKNDEQQAPIKNITILNT